MKRKTRNIKEHKPRKRKKASIDRVRIDAILRTPLFWSPPPVEVEPMTRLETWTVYRATPSGAPSERFGLHFVGRNLRRWCGCVSSEIVSFDSKALRGTTRDGRIYQLYGSPAHCRDAENALGWWKRFNNLAAEDVTAEFLESHGLTLAELDQRFARGEVRPILVFLDFDGVLHPAPPHNRDTGVFTCVERFESVMRVFPMCRIAITSSWRQAFDLETIRGFFNDKIAARIIGVTPVIDPEVPYARQREIEQYLGETGQSSVPWLALDDQPEAFEPRLTNLVLCDKEVGFDEVAASNLDRKLRELV